MDTAVLIVAAVIGNGAAFLLFFGEHISKRIRARRSADIRQAWASNHHREYK